MIFFDPFWPFSTIIKYIWDLMFGGGTTTVEGKSIGVLGMPEAGKTQFYKTLKNEKYLTHEATATEDYPEFDFKINNKSIKVKPGRDIGGGEHYIFSYYAKFISEKDIIVFVFDVKRYIEDYKYQRDVRDRLDFIWRRLTEKSGVVGSVAMSTHYIQTKFILFASHFDQLTKDQQSKAKGLLHKTVEGKDFEQMFHNNMYIVDLRDRNLLFEIFNKTNLFG